MGWSGTITSSSAVGTAITFTPSTSSEGAYTVSAFTAPRKGVYRFQLYGSGGTKWGSGNSLIGSSKRGGTDGGKGGYTDGYLLLEKGQTVYVGAGGTCSAAFVSSVTGAKLASIAKANLFLVAGGGGGGSAWSDWVNGNGSNCTVIAGSAGGGTAGVTSSNSYVGKPGTQTAGGAAGGSLSSAGSYGTGGAGGDGGNSNYECYAGRGGDGLYGGGGGYGKVESNGMTAAGGGGGSGYVKAPTQNVYGKTYTSTTSQGGGSAAGANGKVIVTYYALASIPVTFNGSTVTEIVFNGTTITG